MCGCMRLFARDHNGDGPALGEVVEGLHVIIGKSVRVYDTMCACKVVRARTSVRVCVFARDHCYAMAMRTRL